MDRIFAIGGGVLLVIIILGGYVFMRGNRGDDLAAQRNKLQEALTLAEKKLNKEKETLGALTERLQNSFSFAVSVQEQMKKSSDIVRQTDFMFTNPYGLNPELIIKNLKTSILINNERRDVNLLLSQWQKEIDLLSVEKIDANESEKIRQDIQTIKSFLENLSQVVKNLTTKNSGLSQFQIDTYSAQLPSVEVVNTILVSMENAIEDFHNNNSQTFNTQADAEILNNQTFSNSASDIPTVTPDDIIREQAVIADAQKEVASLKNQLTQLESQTQQSSPVPTVATPTPIDPTINSGLENANNANNPSFPSNRERIIQQGIIIQPGLPRLIQGTDPF